MTTPNDAIATRPRLLALCGAKSNNEVTKLQLENLGITTHYDIFYLHGAIIEEESDDTIPDGLVRGPFYHWIDVEGGADAMNETIVNSVRLVLKVISSSGPFEMVYGFSNGGIIATLVANISEDVVLKEAVRSPISSTPISTKKVISDEQVLRSIETPGGGGGFRHTISGAFRPRSSTISVGVTGGLSNNRDSITRRGRGGSVLGRLRDTLNGNGRVSRGTRGSLLEALFGGRDSFAISPGVLVGQSFNKVILACAGMSSAGLENITCSSIGSVNGADAESLIHVKSMHLVGMEDPMMPISESMAHLFSEAEIAYLPGGHSVGREERSNKELRSSIQEFIAWSEEYEEMISVIKDIYATVLDAVKDDLSPTSDFFELGGSSLDTIALISRMESTVDIQITQNEFFLNPKIKDLTSRCLEIKASSKQFPKLVALTDSNEPNIWFPASGSQEQMIALWENNPSRYNMGTSIEFTKESIDIDILRQAFQFVVKQQPTLRTVVAIMEGNKFMQKVLPVSDAESCFELKVRTAFSEEELRAIIKEESQFVFPLYDPPIVRGVVVSVADGSDFLFLSQYHVGSDSWALVILRKAILEAYMSIRSVGHASERLTMAAHPNFIDWSMWNRKCLHEFGQEEEQLAYWKNKLNGLPSLALPLDKPRPSSLGSSGMQIPIKIGPDIINQFKAVVKSDGANLYAGLLATYMLVLHCMGGGDDFAVGIALANRNSEGLHDLIGYFANETTVRANFEKETMTFKDHLQAVREAILGGMANADVPFHDVVKALNVPRDGSRTPVFQAFFALQERKWWTLDEICPPAEDNLQFQLKSFSSAIAKFEVHMFIREDEHGGVEGDLTISTDLFEESTGRRIAAMFHKLVEQVVVCKNQDASFLSYDISPDEDKQISVLANETATNFDAPKLSVLDWSCESDSQTALFCHGEGTVSYGELKTMVSRVHTYLAGVDTLQKELPIGLLIRSTSQALASIFGVASFGGSIVVVDPEKTTADRANVIFEDCGVQRVMVDNKFIEKFFDLNGHGYRVVSLDEALSCEPNISLKAEKVLPSSVFGYYYTSGTTGKPKGAIITHGNVLNLINWWSGFFSLNQSDRVLLFSSLSFIMSLRQYLPTLCAGATLVLPSSSINFEPAIIDGKVNKLVCTPSALAVLNIVKVAPNIDAIQVAGEAPRLAVMKAWKSRVENVFIGLGPTELCAHALCGKFDGEIICIGTPAANVKAYVMNPISESEAIVGVPGELWVAGKNVSNGYWNRPELTKKHFVVNPLEPESGLLCYKTGDLAKRLKDGRIQFLGRADTQLKVNGFRMEASEILNALPDGIKGAHVMARNNILVLFKTPERSATEVRKILAEKLPPYMVPQQYFTIDYFPLNKNRKLDVPKLIQDANLDQCMLDSVEDDENEQTREVLLLENTICLVWSKCLEIPVDDIAPISNFFEIGGTSLSAVLVSRALSTELGKEIPVQDVFAHQTLRSLANFLADSNNVVHSGDPRPLLFLPGGRQVLHPILYDFLQGIGLILMSIVIFLPVLGTIVASAQSLLWFGNLLGTALIPAILAGGCLTHLFFVLLFKKAFIGKYSEGKATMFSFFFLKWWLMRRILSSTRLYSWSFDDSFLSGYFLRLFGAKVGQNVSMECANLLEPDLVTIGDNSKVEFEANFNNAEVQKGVLELRSIFVGERVKLGTRSVLLGGSFIHDGSEIAPKSMVDYHSSTSKPMQYLIGSPAKIDKEANLKGDIWMPMKSLWFSIGQILGCFVFLAIFTSCLYVGAKLAQLFQSLFGFVGLILYMMTLFSYVCGLSFLVVAALLKWVLLPRIEEGKVYTSPWFALRKWFLDRLFLSPAYSFALQRSLETTSTYPLYLRILGADIGNKVWLSYIYVRVGMEFLTVEEGVHTGMQTYVSTAVNTKEGTSFHRTIIGEQSSCGQRSIILSGTHIGSNATIGAETCAQENTVILNNETAFGSPLVVFKTSKTNQEVVLQSQKHILSSGISSKIQQHTEPMGRQGGNVHLPFWLYALIMNLAQFCLPLIIIGSYAAIYAAFYFGFGGLGVVGIVFMIPVTYILGSIVLMLAIKSLQLIFFGGKFSKGTIEFYSVRFQCWYFLSDLVYLCTQTFFVPFSGTELFCSWLRLMGSDIGKRVFFSPENGGLRELDFLVVGDGCHILTPNINSHYADHGIMQFYPVVFSAGCEINPGATVMPLTEYGAECVIRPHTVTTKGQCCKGGTTYVGNPAKPVGGSQERSAILFAGLGSSYPGMLKGIEAYPRALALLQEASTILGVDIGKMCEADVNPKVLEDASMAQLIVTVVNIVSGEIMRQREPMAISRARIVAGFSVGEFAALHFAGAISLEDTLKLVKVQCEEFSKINVSSTLCNVRGLSRNRVEEICIRFKCRIANIISDHDEKTGSVSRNVYVCGGTVSGINKFIHFVNELAIGDGSVLGQIEGGERSHQISAKKLRVNTANHTRLMMPAMASFKQALAKTRIKMPREYIVYSNVTGRPYRSVYDIRTFLSLQMIKPVQWHSVISSIHFDEGCDHFLECGAMRSQSAMVKLILKDDVDDLQFFSSDKNKS